MARKPTGEDWFVCPHCGSVLVGDPGRCDRCGSDAETGWSPDAGRSDLDLPGDEEFDYDAFVHEEFGAGAPARRLPAWVLVGALLALAALLLFLLPW